MMSRWMAVLLVAAGVAFTASAQRDRSEQGFELGTLYVGPVAEATAAYDNRVVSAGDDSDGDFYSEAGVAVDVRNRPALINLSADAGYGYRFYDTYADMLNSEFYHGRIALRSTDDRPLQVGVSGQIKKTLDYDTRFGTEEGQEPGAILTSEESTRYTTRAGIGYERNVTDKTTIEPGYEYWNYFQDFRDSNDAEWEVHRAGLQVGYGYSGKTRAYLSGYYSLQRNDQEDGKIAEILIGAAGEATDKADWQAHIGVASAEYDQSGSEQGLVGLLRGTWALTDKVDLYAYGRSAFEPGYNGNARQVYRMGYGGRWRVLDRWSVGAQLLHDYQEELGNASSDEMKHFARIDSEYELGFGFALGAGFKYVIDEEETDQMVASLTALYRY